MNMPWAIILLVGGLVILWKCADLLVAGAVSLAVLLGVSPLVAGLTIVAMGTSAPEVAASIAGVFRENGGDLALGNVFGSNIANLALVGGVIAIISPLVVQKRTLRREVPVMLLVILLLFPFVHDYQITRGEATLLLAVFASLLFLTVHVARRESRSRMSEDDLGVEIDTKHVKKNVIYIIIGLIGLAIGADMALRGAVFIGEAIGLSKAVIALTIVAFGTSLPELVTCVVATLKGHHDISVGNLVGSNIFNTLLVTGAAGMVKPFELSEGRLAGGIDYWIVVIVSVAFALTAILGRRKIGRRAGAALVCSYIAYLIYLFSTVSPQVIPGGPCG
ncbi:MAG: calcium/sodium antiporter [Phycisphaerae bacterium]|nr:calcium/sodium antiporter [Phycisphaerae bacterium]